MCKCCVQLYFSRNNLYLPMQVHVQCTCSWGHWHIITHGLWVYQKHSYLSNILVDTLLRVDMQNVLILLRSELFTGGSMYWYTPPPLCNSEYPPFQGLTSQQANLKITYAMLVLLRKVCLLYLCKEARKSQFGKLELFSRNNQETNKFEVFSNHQIL